MLHTASVSHIGDRPVNEDSCAVCPLDDGALLCLADGLGGHGRGDEASQTAVGCAGALITQPAQAGEAPPLPDALLQSIFEAAQTALHARQQQEGCPGAMKTTLNLALVQADTLYWGHVGDSRTYVFRKNRVLCRTRDHSVPQALVASGELREKDIRRHPDRNRLLRVLDGGEEPPRFELKDPLALDAGDALLLCSDGFWENITEREMQKALKKARGDVRLWLQSMDAVVQRRGSRHGGMDNNTAVAAILE